MSLEMWGWDEKWAEQFTALGIRDGVAGRVIAQERNLWIAQTASGPVGVRGPRSVDAESRATVGDWIVLRRDASEAETGSIVAVLPRRTAFSRGAAGSGKEEQVLAANVDTTWIVHGLDSPPNLRRIERYLAVAWESGSTPEVVLTKADLSDDVDRDLGAVRTAVFGTAVWVVSTAEPASIDGLRTSLYSGRTVVLLGPSGAGKSTLVNALAGADVASTGVVREADRKGRHTTTRRELYPIPGGALLMDTPGLRELRVWDLDEGLSQTFPEIEELAMKCRFRDCGHESEPGCAVLAGVAEGRLESERLLSFKKLRAEAAYLERKSDPRAAAAHVAAHKTALKTLRFHPKYNPPR